MYAQDTTDDNRILNGEWEYTFLGALNGTQKGRIRFDYVDGKQTAVMQYNLIDYEIEEIKNHYHTYTFNVVIDGNNMIMTFDYGLDTMRGNVISDGWQTRVILQRVK